MRKNGQYDVVHRPEKKSKTVNHGHQITRNNDVLRRQAGSYLIAMKGLMNKADPGSHFVQLI